MAGEMTKEEFDAKFAAEMAAMAQKARDPGFVAEAKRKAAPLNVRQSIG